MCWSCSRSFFEAANGPLQQRTLILDLDASRANHVPDDYDTDLESEWANPSTFHIHFAMSLLCTVSRSVCRWHWLLVGHDPIRAKSVLSATARQSDPVEDHCNSWTVNQGFERASQYGPEYDDEHVVCLHVGRDCIRSIAGQQNPPSIW